MTTTKLTPRQARAVEALLPGRWIARETLGRIAGCSNAPDLVYKLRKKLGQDAIEMQLDEHVDRDGQVCKPGRYRMTDAGRERLMRAGMLVTGGRA